MGSTGYEANQAIDVCSILCTCMYVCMHVSISRYTHDTIVLRVHVPPQSTYSGTSEQRTNWGRSFCPL